MLHKVVLIVSMLLVVIVGIQLNSDKKEVYFHANHHPSFNRNDFMLQKNSLHVPRIQENIFSLEEKLKEITQRSYPIPRQWGENVSGVIQRLPTEQKTIALTFDACGGEWGSGYDDELITYLVLEQIPATLFINHRWIEQNEEIFLFLAEQDLFQIENHGTEHKPLSVTGGTAWGIKGTSSIEEVVNEIMINYQSIKELTGHHSRFFRSGTAFYDEVAVQIIEDLGMRAVNYDILGDAGATYSATQVKEALLKSRPGSIALLHMNQPSKGTAEGVKLAIPQLRKNGYSFVTLNQGFGLE